MKLLIAFVILNFSISCGRLPTRPNYSICTHSVELDVVLCVDDNNSSYELRVDQTDKYIMFSPDDWGAILIYIKLIEQRSPKRAKKVKKRLGLHGIWIN